MKQKKTHRQPLLPWLLAGGIAASGSLFVYAVTAPQQPAAGWLYFGSFGLLCALLILFCRYSGLERWLQPHWRLFCCLVGAGLFLSAFALHPNLLYLGDSHLYWTAMDRAFRSGDLLAIAHDDGFRGYFLLLLIGILKRLLLFAGVPEAVSYAIGTSLLSAAVFTLLLPDVFGALFPAMALRGWTVLLPSALLFLFWWGILVYPLSDLWAAMLLITVLWLLQKLTGAGLSPARRAAAALAAGFLLYALYNTRTMYILLLPLITLWLAVKLLWKHPLRGTALLLCYLAGSTLAALPQMAVNARLYNIASPTVQTGILFGNSMDLITWQCLVGLQYQRYDTYIGDPSVHGPSLYFADAAGQKLSVNRTEGIRTKGEYLQFVLQNLLSCSGVYGRHYLNMANNCYPETYVQHLHRDRTAEIVVNYLCWFTGLTGIFWRYSMYQAEPSDRRRKGAQLRQRLLGRDFYLLFWCLSSLLSAAGAVEVRFFLPVYLLLYACIGGVVQQASYRAWIKRHAAFACACGLVLFLLCNSVWSDTLGQLM